METLVYSLLVFVLGVCIGSFLNVVIYRVPLGKNIITSSSECMSCGNKLKFYHNVPIISWLFLRGKCGFCKTKLSAQYPIIELITGILALILFWKIGLVWYMPFVFLSFASLFALSMIDFKYMAVPDSVNITALLFSLITVTYIDNFLYAVIAAGLLFSISLFTSIVAKKKAMGSADIIVAATMGALLGFPNFFIALFLSAVLAMLPSLIHKDKPLPFIPFLSLATLIIYVYDKETGELIQWILYR